MAHAGARGHRSPAGAGATPRFPALFLLLVLLSAGWVEPARAFDLVDQAPDLPLSRPRFRADGGTRLAAAGPEAVLALEVPYAELFFRPAGTRWRTRFDLIFVLRDGRRQVAGELFSEAIEVRSREEARAGASHVRRTVPLRVPPGRYRAEVILREALAGRETRVEWPLEVPDYARSRLSLSSLWISEGPPGGDTLSAALPPAGWRLSRRFGETGVPIRVHGEIYRASGDTVPVRLSWRVLGGRGEEHQKGEAVLPAAATTPFQLAPDLSSLWIGNYLFELQARAGEAEARRRFEFQVDASAGAMEADTEQSLELVALIADADEIRRLREAPGAERKEEWNRFWKRRDPTPESPQNEFRDEFFARVRHANEQFAAGGPGWRTDRGRTYIRYGPPDQIESHPLNLDSPAYEIWTYLRSGRRFVFVDYDGYGRYEFYQPGRS